VIIKARLKGHEFHLLTLAELLRKGDPAVAIDDEGYCLSFTAPEGLLDDGSRLHDATSVLLRRVNGVARTLSSDFRPGPAPTFRSSSWDAVLPYYRP
jgi:hypothetical protein